MLGQDLKSLQELIVDSIKQCPEDLHPDLFANLVTMGGTSNLEGFNERLTEEISKITP